jgi:hypothetical protein
MLWRAAHFGTRFQITEGTIANRTRITYLSLYQYLSVLMPTNLHQCGTAWLINQYGEWRAARLTPEVWPKTMNLMNAPG